MNLPLPIEPALRAAALPQRRLWRLGEAAQLLGISRATLWRHVRAGKVRSVELGGRRQIPESEIARIAKEGVR